MLNDRDDMPDDHEDSEYHFSDEDVSYEVETESSKPAHAPSNSGGLLARVTQSKRMLISVGVFVALVFVVYKMVAPTATNVATDITTPVASNQNSNSAAMQQQVPQAAPKAPVTAQTDQTTAAPAMSSPSPAVEVAVNPPADANTAPPVAPNTPPEVAAQPQAVASMPPVIAVQPPQNNAPTTNTATTTTTTVSNAATSQAAAPALSPTDAAIAKLSATNEQLMMQLQSDYTQKINDYATQNKLLQDQMQALSNRVSTMEAQLTQLIQALTPQSPAQSSNQTQTLAPGSLVPEKPSVSAAEVKSAYTVQAVIPGRAWLRSENGEAITVAEGDTIKDLGRVTKIDPYDGVVEVNTGKKTLSLSYGNGNE